MIALAGAERLKRGLVDPLDTPEHTEGREGYCYITSMANNSATATVKIKYADFQIVTRSRTLLEAPADKAMPSRSKAICPVSAFSPGRWKKLVLPTRSVPSAV